MKDSDVIVLEEPRLSATDALYVPQIGIGMKTTLKHLWDTIRPGGGRVVRYPEEQRDAHTPAHGGMDPEAMRLGQQTYRGVHRLNRDEQGRVKCVSCFMCSTACPAHCIHIVAGESPWPDREKYPVKFDIDELRCIYCGMCEEACPCDAIELTSIIDLVGVTRQEMIYDKEKLLSIYDATVKEEPM